MIGTDAEGNVTRVQWRFDPGFTQTYTFEYAPAVSRSAAAGR